MAAHYLWGNIQNPAVENESMFYLWFKHHRNILKAT